MTITQLTTFVKIAGSGSFTKAADDLKYAQSTVTTQIRQLEDELGCLLFERLGKKVVLTPAGERLLTYAQKILQMEREILAEVPGDTEPSGLLKLGVSESLCYERLPGLLMEYSRKYPKVEIRLQFIMHDTFPELLRRGEIDMAYSLNPDIADDSLKLLFERRETLGFYASPALPIASKKSISEKDLEDVPLLLTSHECSFRRMLLSSIESAGVSCRIAMETGSKEILRQFAARGFGVAFMPDMAAGDAVSRKQLVRLNWKGSDFPVYSRVFVHKDKHIGSALRSLVDMIAAG